MQQSLRKPVLTVLRWQLAVTAALTLLAGTLAGSHGAVSAALGGSVEAALEAFTAALAQRLAEWRRDGFEAVRAHWLAKAGPLGTEVDVKLGDELVRGRFGGVDHEGALLLETSSGPRRIVSGELLGRAA